VKFPQNTFRIQERILKERKRSTDYVFSDSFVYGEFKTCRLFGRSC